MIKEKLKAALDLVGRKVLGRKSYVHYIRPYTVPSKKVAYDGGSYWDSWYKSTDNNIQDKTTISHSADGLTTKFHYNAVENSIIDALLSTKTTQFDKMLDIGSGSGHWINFYSDIFDIKNIVGVDISEICVHKLQKDFLDNPDYNFYCANIASDDLKIGNNYDLVNAIGVMFHIVADTDWDKAISNLAAIMKKGGIMIVGGNFSSVTADVQFHRTDIFEEHNKTAQLDGDKVLVNKRIRSLKLWKKQARKHGLEFQQLTKTVESRNFFSPENNIITLKKV